MPRKQESNDENFSDEAEIKKKLEEEKKKSEGYKRQLNSLQLQKKKIQEKLSEMKSKMKGLEDEVTENTMLLEKLKSEKGEYVKTVDKKDIANQIDKGCKTVFEGFLEQVGSTKKGYSDYAIMQPEIDVDVQFKDDLKTLTVKSDHKLFKDFKAYCAAAFSLQPQSFFFCEQFNLSQGGEQQNGYNSDGYNKKKIKKVVYLDNLDIRKTLFPFDQKIKNTHPKLFIVLTNDADFGELINSRTDKEPVSVVKKNVVNNTVKAKENEFDDKMKDLERKEQERKKDSRNYDKKQQRLMKFVGLFRTAMFLSLILMWIVNLYNRFQFRNSFTMRSTIDNIFSDVYTQIDPVEFYKQLNQDIMQKDLDEEDDSTFRPYYGYPYLEMNYFMLKGKVTMKRYKIVTCEFTNDYIEEYGLDSTCFDPQTIDKTTYKAGNIDYEYEEPDTITLTTPFINIDTTGHQFELVFNRESEYSKKSSDLTEFMNDAKAINSYVISLVIINPSLEKMACFYRTIYWFNHDEYKQYDFIYTLNLTENPEPVLSRLVIAFACLLLFFSVWDLIKICHKNKATIDIDLIEYLNPSATQTEGAKKKTVIKLGSYYLILFRPSFLNLFNMITIILIVWSSARDLSFQSDVDAIEANADQFINCTTLINKNQEVLVLSCILVIILMISLLRYISDLIPFLYEFVQMIATLLSNVSTLTLVIVWIFLTLSIFGVFTFGMFWENFAQFAYFYAGLILLLMKRNEFFSGFGDEDSLQDIQANIGMFTIVFLFLFSYIFLTFVMIKIITAIIIKSIKSAQERIKEEQKRRNELMKSFSKRFTKFKFPGQKAKPEDAAEN